MTLNLEEMGSSRKWLNGFASFYSIIGAVAFALCAVKGYYEQDWLVVLYGFIVLVSCLLCFALLRGAADVLEYLHALAGIQREMLKLTDEKHGSA